MAGDPFPQGCVAFPTGTDVRATFKIPGQRKKANTRGFGISLFDVDFENETSLKFLDRNRCLITRVIAPVKRGGLTFIGVIVFNPNNPTQQIPAINTVSMDLGIPSPPSEFGCTDCVPFDNLVYGEPTSGDSGKCVLEPKCTV